MSNQFLKLRRSSVPGKVPTTSSLEFGEIALNTYDGLAFIKKSGSNGEEIITIGATSGSFTGSLFGTASWAEQALTSSYSLNIDGEQYYVAVYTGNNTLGTGSFYDSGSFTAIGSTTPTDPANPERLFVDAGNTTSYNLISGHGEIDSYLQLNVQNFSYGSTASADIVATANDGTENDNYIDMGINNSGYNVQDGIGGPNDAYLYSTGNDLLIGNASDGKKIIIFNGSGGSLANARIIVFDQGTVGINANTANNLNPEALLVEPLPGSTNDFNNLIVGRAEVQENYVQLNIQNTGTGSLASSDIVATNDIGTETDYYIDMGINSSNYSTPNAVGMANDAYLYSTGEHLHIGNASAGMPVMFFAGGFDSEANRKLELWPNNQHQMTGSLNASEGFTGSLYGTASWALNTLTASFVQQAVSASYALTASYALNAGGATTVTVADEGTAQGVATFLNFTGAGVTATVSSNTASINIPGGSGDTFPYTGSAVISGSLQVTGSVSSTGGFTGSLEGTASWAINALTASSADNFTVRQDITASNALFTGTITAQRLNVQYITASTEFITGSTKFGTQLTDTHQFTGSVSITGSLSVYGALNATSSWAINASTASFVATSSWANNAVTASYVLNAVSSSFASTASFVTLAQTASYVQQAQTASYVLQAVSSSFASTASYVQTAQTASFVATASWANNAVTASFVTTAQTASFVTASNVWGPFGSNSVVSSSYALTASFALNAGGASAAITNQIATGSVTASVNINSASFQLTSASVRLLFVSNSGIITGQRMFLSASQNTASGSTLTLYGSGSAQPVFTVQGSQGELFSVTDSLSGSLFSVNDISGLPVIEAFSDNRVLIGSYQAPALFTTVRVTSTAGNNVIYQNLPTASYDGAFFDYTVKSGSNARAGQITAIWSGSAVNYTETTTTDFGDTSGVRFMVMITGSNMALTGSFPSASWTIKTIVRSI